MSRTDVFDLGFDTSYDVNFHGRKITVRHYVCEFKEYVTLAMLLQRHLELSSKQDSTKPIAEQEELVGQLHSVERLMCDFVDATIIDITGCTFGGKSWSDLSSKEKQGYILRYNLGIFVKPLVDSISRINSDDELKKNRE